MGHDDYTVAVGDAVMVSRQWDGRRGARESIVEKIGRKLIYIDGYPYRIDDQQLNTGYFGRFWTLDQWAEYQAEQAARAALREHGIDLRSGVDWTPAQLVKLAALVAELRA